MDVLQLFLLMYFMSCVVAFNSRHDPTADLRRIIACPSIIDYTTAICRKRVHVAAKVYSKHQRPWEAIRVQLLSQ